MQKTQVPTAAKQADAWEDCWRFSLWKKATIHQLTIMLSTSKNVLFPGHNHLLTTDADDMTF